MAFNELSTILWRERQLLELLLFKLEEEQLLLTAGKSRWLTFAAREVEAVLEDIKHAELARSVEVQAVVDELGITGEPTLRALIEAAPAPWDEILGDHRDAFLTSTQEILALAQANRELITKGQRAVQDAISWLAGPGNDETTYSRTGTTTRSGDAARMLDQAM